MWVKSYKDLIVWQKAIELAVVIYDYSKVFPKDETFGLRQQIRRAAVSIASNIAEGQCRSGTKEFLNFPSVAHGSLAEVQTQVVICDRLSFFNKEQAAEFQSLIGEIARLLHGLKKSLTPNH